MRQARADGPPRSSAIADVPRKARGDRRAVRGSGLLMVNTLGNLPMPVYSHSRIESFRHCPRKYFYRYIAKIELPEQPEQIATFLGSRVHAVLEHLYERVAKGIVPSVESLREQFDQEWASQWTPAVVIHDRGATPDDYISLGWRCIEKYYQRFHPFDQATVIGLEQMINFPLDEAGRFKMIGYIDRLTKTADGCWQIHDYKTNSSLPTQAEKDDDPQLAYYEIGIRRMWKGVEHVELIWHFLRFDHSIVSTRTPSQLDQLRAEAIATITDIEGRGDHTSRFPTHEGPLCSYCEYQQVCPARKHLYQVRVMPESDLATEPAVALVDRWAELDSKRKLLQGEQGDIEGQIEEIRQALLAIAQRDGLELIAGRRTEVAITVNDRVLFPRKGQEPEKAAELEAALRATPWWPQLSSLNIGDLRTAWESAETNSELRRILEKFVWTDREISVRLRARRDHK